MISIKNKRIQIQHCKLFIYIHILYCQQKYMTYCNISGQRYGLHNHPCPEIIPFNLLKCEKDMPTVQFIIILILV